MVDVGDVGPGGAIAIGTIANLMILALLFMPSSAPLVTRTRVHASRGPSQLKKRAIGSVVRSRPTQTTRPCPRS